MRAAIDAATKEAMKAQDKTRLVTLRMMSSAIKNAEIEARGQGKELTEDALLSLMQKLVKQRQESAELYDKGGRAELAANERAEIGIIQSFLPQQMSEEETRAAIEAAIAESGAEGMKDMGKVIGVLKGKYPGRMDFGKVSGVVRSMLA